jgi:hypothetical protein
MTRHPDPHESRARELASTLHATQTDKAGRPYIEHLTAVVDILLRRWPDAPAHAVEAAWLHDALEDTDVSPGGLRDYGISLEAIRLIYELTRPDDNFYLAWIRGLADGGDLWSIRIKLADNEHNSAPDRALPGSDLVERRYAPLRAGGRILEDAERRRGERRTSEADRKDTR